MPRGPAEAVAETNLLEWRDARRRRLAAAGAASATSGAGTWTSRGTRPAGSRRACRAACSTISWRAGEVPDLVPRAHEPARASGCRSGRGSTARRRDGPGRDPVRGRRSRGDGRSRRRGGRARTRARSRRSRSSVGAGEHRSRSSSTPAPESEPQVGRTSRVRVHKSRMGYGWDFCPRMIHQGIWRPVTSTRPAGGRADGAARGRPRHGRARRRGRAAGRVPRLWWPNGMGEQHLYDGRGRAASASATSSSTSATRSSSTAIRAPIQGWNWCRSTRSTACRGRRSCSACSASPRASGANLLRVWGGGLIETPEFYDHCDRLGLLVWQEFSQSSSGIDSMPSDDPGFVATLAADAREIVPRLPRTASLAIWGGGNELDGDDSTPVLAALRDVVDGARSRARLARRRSPSPDDRDLHGPWEHQGLRKHNEHYDSRVCELHSEFGVEGMTNREALEALIAGGAALAGRPDEPRLRAPRRVVEQRAASCRRRSADGSTTSRRCAAPLSGCSTTASATRSRRRCGAAPGRSRGSSTSRIRTPGARRPSTTTALPKPAYWGVRRAYAGAPSASFATCAWGGDDEVRARVWGDATARIVELDGGVVVEAEGEIAVPARSHSRATSSCSTSRGATAT